MQLRAFLLLQAYQGIHCRTLFERATCEPVKRRILVIETSKSHPEAPPELVEGPVEGWLLRQ